MKQVLVSVINDLVTDQRVHRTCSLLVEMGFEVELIGRRKKGSQDLDQRSYKMTRMNLIFEHGPLFYAEFNVRLFFLLLFRKSTLLFSNDLDTLLPNYLISLLKGKKLVYDSHEYFTEVPELVSRPKVQKVWRGIEEFVLNRMSRIITVNESIAALFREKYGVKVDVVRNVPIDFKSVQTDKTERLIILQGAGINVDRGGEELIQAMESIEGVLWVVGDGDAIPLLKKMVNDLRLEKKVVFKGKVPLQTLKEYTSKAQIGVSLDKATNVNYQFSLPNKIFDYMQASCAIVTSDLVEIRRIVENYNSGVILKEVSPEVIAITINDLLDDKERLLSYQQNANLASKELCWKNEKQSLKYSINQIILE